MKYVLLLCALLNCVFGYSPQTDRAFPDFGSNPFNGILTFNYLVANRNISITVFDRDNNGNFDMDSDVWVFDAQSNGKAELLIDFNLTENLTAYVYDDFDNDSSVEYKISERNLTVLEKNFKLKITALNNQWFYANGQPDYNLRIETHSPWRLYGGDVTVYFDASANNDTFYMEIRDVNNDSIPDYEYDSHTLAADGLNVHVGKNKDPSTMSKLSKIIVLPALSVLEMDWEKAKITELTHFISTRYKEDNFFIYFMKDYSHLPGSDIRYGFENPFAYYDLAEDNDSQPEMIIRMVDANAYENKEDLKNGENHYMEVSYNIDNDNDGDLDYAMYMIGWNKYDEINSYPWFKVKHVPYEILPFWIFNRSWIGASFISDEKDISGLGEGIYENYVYTAKLRGVLFQNESNALQRYYPMLIGHREEYNFHLNAKPEIYLSPIDGKYHLYNMTHGVYIIGAKKDEDGWSGVSDFAFEKLHTGILPTHEKIEYFNDDEDPYVDKWILYIDDAENERLEYDDETLCYSNESKTSCKKIGIADFDIKMSMPQSKEELEEFNKYQGNVSQIVSLKDLFCRFKTKEYSLASRFSDYFYLLAFCLVICMLFANKLIRKGKNKTT